MHAAPLASAEIDNPATSGFSTTGSLASARIAHTATLLNNGQVLITGGNSFTAGCGSKVGSSVNGMSSAELYTPAVLVPAPALFSTSGEGNGQGIGTRKPGRLLRRTTLPGRERRYRCTPPASLKEV